VAISNSTTVESGQATVLVCVGYGGAADVNITWSYEGQTISNDSLRTVMEETLEQGGRTFKHSYLQLCSVQASQSGNYTCSVSNGVTTQTSDVTLSVTGGCGWVWVVKEGHDG